MSHPWVAEFGFSSFGNGFYAYGGAAAPVKEGSQPDTDRWVTLWADLYLDGGNLKANLGWCELSQTPFIDGLRIAGYDVNDRDFKYLGMVDQSQTSGYATFDNVAISSPPAEPANTIDFEKPPYTVGSLLESVHARAYREIGDPAGMALMDKAFVVARRYDSPGGWDGRWDMYANGNPQVPLPMILSAAALGLDTRRPTLSAARRIRPGSRSMWPTT